MPARCPIYSLTACLQQQSVATYLYKPREDPYNLTNDTTSPRTTIETHR